MNKFHILISDCSGVGLEALKCTACLQASSLCRMSKKYSFVTGTRSISKYFLLFYPFLNRRPLAHIIFFFAAGTAPSKIVNAQILVAHTVWLRA